MVLGLFPNRSIGTSNESVPFNSHPLNESIRFEIDSYFFVSFTLFLSVLIIISTTVDCLRKSLGKVESSVLLNQLDEPNNQSIKPPKSDFKKLLACKKFIDTFSILSSINRLTFVDKDVTINCIYGFKLFSIIWIIFGHSYIYSAGIADNYDQFKYQITHQFISRLVLNCTFAVDTFFTLSGFLLSYLLFKRKLLNSEFWKVNNLLIFYFNRYWRLTPVYAFVLWFYTSFLNRIGNGPFWHLFEARNCETLWWHNLIYINNFDKFSEECMSHTWYLSNDFQFFILSPILLYLLSRQSKLSYLVVGAIILTSSGITFIISFVNGLHETNGFLNLSNDHNYINLIYQKPYCRIGSYLIGLLFGYMLNESERMKSLSGTIYVYIGDLISYTIFISTIFIYSNEWSHIEYSIYFSLSRQIWSVCICWLILSCHLRPKSLLNRLLSLRVFVVLSRLTYSVYLVHPIMLTFYFYTRKEQITVNHSTVLFYASVTTIYSFIFALLLNIVVEIPLSNLNFLKKK